MTKKGWGILISVSGAVVLGSAGYYFMVYVPKNKAKAELEKAKSDAALAGKSVSNNAGTKTAPTTTVEMVDTKIGDTVWADEDNVPLYKSNALIPPYNSPNLGPSNLAKTIKNGEKIGIAGPFDGNFLTVYRDESWFGGEASTYYVYTDSKTSV